MTRPQRGRPRRAGRRGNAEGTAPFLRSDGRWSAAVTSTAGRKWFYGKTRDEVAGKLAKAVAAARDGKRLPNEKLTVGKFLDDWLENTVKPHRKPGTYLAYKRAVTLYIVPRFKTLPLARLEPEHIELLQNAMREKGKSPATIQLVRASLSSALRKAERQRKILSNPVTLSDAPPRVNREPQVLTPAQADQLLRTAAGHEFEQLYRTMLATGLRIGEALGLRWVDIEPDWTHLQVRQQLIEIPRQPRREGPPKSRSGERVVPLIPAAVAALRAQQARVTAYRQHAGSLWQARDLVFPDELGAFLVSRRVDRVFKQHLERAGLLMLLRRCRLCGGTWHDARAGCPTPKPVDATPHTLRHSCGTYLTKEGVPDRVVMAILGHSNPEMTRRYQHVLNSMLTDAAERLARALPADVA